MHIAVTFLALQTKRKDVKKLSMAYRPMQYSYYVKNVFNQLRVTPNIITVHRHPQLSANTCHFILSCELAKQMDCKYSNIGIWL